MGIKNPMRQECGQVYEFPDENVLRALIKNYSGEIIVDSNDIYLLKLFLVLTDYAG